MVEAGVFFFKDTAPTEIDTLSLHDALPISVRASAGRPCASKSATLLYRSSRLFGSMSRPFCPASAALDRKSTRLNSSHANISYAVFCLKKKNTPYKSPHLITLIYSQPASAQ